MKRLEVSGADRPLQGSLGVKGLMELLNFLDRFSKNAQISNFIKIRGSRVVPCGRTDRHDEVNSRFSQFCERAQKLSPKY